MLVIWMEHGVGLGLIWFGDAEFWMRIMRMLSAVGRDGGRLTPGLSTTGVDQMVNCY